MTHCSMTVLNRTPFAFQSINHYARTINYQIFHFYARLTIRVILIVKELNTHTRDEHGKKNKYILYKIINWHI